MSIVDPLASNNQEANIPIIVLAMLVIQWQNVLVPRLSSTDNKVIPSVVSQRIFYCVVPHAVIPAKALIQVKGTGFRIKSGMTTYCKVISETLH